VVVGMTLVGPAVGEMIHAATMAVAGEVPIDRLWHAVPSFPTISEVWLRLLEALNAEIICPKEQRFEKVPAAASLDIGREEKRTALQNPLQVRLA
jgi:hypothetical protein